MAIRVEPGDWKNPLAVQRQQARYGDGNPIRGLHQGQRSCEPRKQAGYMTAPDQIVVNVKIILAKQGPSIQDS
jgi:hypothetical protein